MLGSMIGTYLFNINEIFMRLSFTAITSALSVIGIFSPVVASAATITDTLVFISGFLNSLIGLFITLAIVVFFWGLIKYLWSMGSEDAHEGLKIMFWGIIAIFVMVSIWGIIGLLQNTFKVGSDGVPPVPGGFLVNPRS
ncbi:MAG: hypothetical protein AAB947_00350 [Patescibacteria group bacterium]